MEWDIQLTGGGEIAPNATNMTTILEPQDCLAQCQAEISCEFWSWVPDCGNGGAALAVPAAEHAWGLLGVAF